MLGKFKQHILKSGLSLKNSNNERGTAFILVLVFLLIAGLLLPPLLTFMGTGLLTGQIYETKTQSLYAADSGIDSGIWTIKHDEMQSFSSYEPLGYYDNNPSYEWSYTIGEEINNATVDVSIRNVWIPSNISAPSLADATNIMNSEKLIISGSRNSTDDSYTIHIIFTPASPEEKENLKVDSIGVYLPPGYHYVNGSSNLEQDYLALWYSVPNVSSYGSNEVVIWSGFGSLKFSDLPPLGSTETATITFDYTSETDENLKAVSWIKTTGVVDIPYTWDNNHKFYQVISYDGATDLDSYVLLPGPDNLNIYGGALVSGGDIWLKKDSEVNGDIMYAGSFNAQNPFTHNDGELINMEIELPSAEENENFADGVKLEAQSHATYTGTYYVPKGNGADITDLGPIYIDGDLEIAKDNIINFIGPIYVEGEIDMDKDAEFTGGGQVIAVGDIYLAKSNDFGSDGGALLMSLNGSATFKKEVDIRALIYVPNGNVQFDKGGNVNGSVIAGGNIQADKEGTFTQTYDYYNVIDIPGFYPEQLDTITWELD